MPNVEVEEKNLKNREILDGSEAPVMEVLIGLLQWVSPEKEFAMEWNLLPLFNDQFDNIFKVAIESKR